MIEDVLYNLLNIFSTLIAAVCGYLIGSLNFAVIISKQFYKDDIRKHGSGNAGTTNMLRTFGKKAAILTLLGDLLKGVVAAVTFGLIMKAIGFTYTIGATVAGFFAILGHNWPVYFKFKGGKGIMTSFAVILTIMPIEGLICFGIFLIVVCISKHISLGSICASAALPVVTLISLLSFRNERPENFMYLLVFSATVSIMAIIRHKANIKRLVKGEESKFSLKKSK